MVEMHTKLVSHTKINRKTVRLDPSYFIDGELASLNKSPQADLIQSLLHQIIRVKELIRYHESVPNNGGLLGASILNELVSEAYHSLVNYDLVLMNNYFELLESCD